MSLIVEDGTIVAGAESYCSVTFATTYHANRGNAAWAALSDTVREQNLRKATEYMVGFYRLKWKGVRASLDQVLDWPRLNVQLEDVGFGSIQAYVAANTVPTEVKNACAALALIASTEELAPALDRQTTSEKVGSIEVHYAEGTVEYKRYRAIDLMLKTYLETTGIMGKLVRA